MINILHQLEGKKKKKKVLGSIFSLTKYGCDWIFFDLVYRKETADLLPFKRWVCVPYLKVACMAVAVVNLINLWGLILEFLMCTMMAKAMFRNELQRRCQNIPCKTEQEHFVLNVMQHYHCLKCFVPYHKKILVICSWQLNTFQSCKFE